MQHPQGLRSLSTCAYWGIVVSSTIRWPVFASSALTLEAVTVVFCEVNSVCNIHSRVQPCPADKYVHLLKQLQPFECGHIIGLWEPGWAYRVAAHVGHNVSVVCRCFQQWSVEHSYTRRLGSGRLRSADANQDRRIVREVVAAQTASREEFRALVAPSASPRATGNCLLVAVLRSSVPLARLLTPWHRQAQLVWCRERGIKPLNTVPCKISPFFAQ